MSHSYHSYHSYETLGAGVKDTETTLSYDHQHQHGKRVTMNRPKQADAATQLARAQAGVWLLPGEVAILFGEPVTRWTVNDWIKAGKFEYRRSAGGQRKCNPDEVLAWLEEYRKTHRDGEPVNPVEN